MSTWKPPNLKKRIFASEIPSRNPEGNKIEIRLIQFIAADGTRKIGAITEAESSPRLLRGINSTYELVTESSKKNIDLRSYAIELMPDEEVDYDRAIAENRLLSPLDHPDPAPFLVSGMGLDHLGSALARNAMHEYQKAEGERSAKGFHENVQPWFTQGQAKGGRGWSSTGMVLQG